MAAPVLVPAPVSVAAALLLFALPALAQAPSDFPYLRLETREASEAATMSAFFPEMTLSPWRVIGPFDNTGQNRHDVVYPPEIALDLDGAITAKDGRTVRWETIEDDGWAMIDLMRFGDGPRDEAANIDSIAYLHRTFEADRDAEVEFETGSDDGLKLWFNGRLVVDADVYRGMNIQDHVVRLPVRQGRNTVLAKVTQGVGSWQFQMRPRLDPRVAALLAYHLDRDFPLTEESRHYRVLTVLEPEGVVLEVGGLTVDDRGRPVVTTRRGEVWVIDGAYDDPPFECDFTRFAAGLHEPLGATWRDGALYVAQRGEVTRLVDRDGDDRADELLTVSDQWGVSGNYHEFAFGPKFDDQGRMWVTLNLGFCGSLGKSVVPWRGWAVIIEPGGSITPVCGGLRSPNGIGGPLDDGSMFFTDNQGDWIATCKLSHLDFGDWHGHPGGDRWYAEAGMQPPRGEEDCKAPAIWFPYDRMGRSASDVVIDRTGGRFGPFEGQLFVGDQYAATVMRVALERVEGVWQGACFPFRSGLDCGVNRLAFGSDGSLFAGLTNRGWWSFGSRPWGLQRLIYTGVLPFEVLTMSAAPDGFVVTFTEPVDAASAGDAASYAMASFTHERWEKYGAPEIDRRELVVRRAEVGADGRSVRLVVDGLRAGYVHELMLDGVRNTAGKPLLHAEAYYTLNVIPGAAAAVREDSVSSASLGPR